MFKKIITSTFYVIVMLVFFLYIIYQIIWVFYNTPVTHDTIKSITDTIGIKIPRLEELVDQQDRKLHELLLNHWVSITILVFFIISLVKAVKYGISHSFNSINSGIPDWAVTYWEKDAVSRSVHFNVVICLISFLGAIGFFIMELCGLNNELWFIVFGFIYILLVLVLSFLVGMQRKGRMYVNK